MPRPDDNFDDGFEEFHSGLYESEEVEDYDPEFQEPPQRKPALRRARSRKKKTAKKRKRRRPFRNTLRKHGQSGWVISGAIAGLMIGIPAILTGYAADNYVASFLNSAISVVTGLTVGVAVRYVAQPTRGWAPSVTAVMIAFCVIMISKFGMACLWIQNRDVVKHNQFYNKQVNRLTSDEAMISSIAREVQEEWLLAEKITNKQLRRFWMQKRLGADPILDISEVEDYDHSANFLPEVWTEATSRWSELPAEKQQTAKETVLKQAGVTHESVAAQLAAKERQKKVIPEHEKQTRKYGVVLYSLMLAFVNLTWPPHAPIFLVISLSCAFIMGTSDQAYQ